MIWLTNCSLGIKQQSITQSDILFYREREDLLIDYIVKYHEQKSRWKTMLMLNAKPGGNV